MRHSRLVVALSAATLIALVACSEPTQPSGPRATPANVAPPTHSPYRITDLGNIGGTTAFAWRINERGQAIGWGTTASGNTHGFFWTAKTGMIDLGTFPRAVGSVAWGLNDDGIVVGEIDLPSGHVRAFLWTASGGMRDLGTLGGDDALAQGVNNKGEVVGYSTLAAGGATHGFVWTARDGMKDAGTLNGANTRLRTIDRSGTTGAGTGQGQAVLWHPSSGFEGLGILPGGGFSYAARINDLAQVAGFSDTDISTHAFRWTAGTGMVDLGALSGTDGRSEALDISNSGGIVGGTTTAADPANLHAFLWTAHRGMRQLPSLTGDTDDEAYGMNESGQIVGYADSPDARTHALLWTPTDQVDVYHVDDQGRVNLITVAGPAVAAHLAQGDALAGVVRPAGSTFSASASLSAATTPDRAFDGSLSSGWNAGDFPTQWIEVGFGSPQRFSSITAFINQFPVTSFTNHDVTLDGVPAFNRSGVANKVAQRSALSALAMKRGRPARRAVRQNAVVCFCSPFRSPFNSVRFRRRGQGSPARSRAP